MPVFSFFASGLIVLLRACAHMCVCTLWWWCCDRLDLNVADSGVQFGRYASVAQKEKQKSGCCGGSS